MAKGFATMEQAFAEIAARKNSGGSYGGPYLKLENGEKALVRFLDDEIAWWYTHPLPKVNDKYQGEEGCRDQDLETGQHTGEPCPGCDEGLRRKMSGIVRLIWFDAPVYEKTEDGKFDYSKSVGNEDQVVTWTVGKMVLEELAGAAATYKGLTSRRFTITRKGVELDTTYDIKPEVDDEGNTVKTPMSKEEKALAEESSEVEFTIPSFEDWGVRGKKKKGGSAPSTSETSPWLRNRRAE